MVDKKIIGKWHFDLNQILQNMQQIMNWKKILFVENISIQTIFSPINQSWRHQKEHKGQLKSIGDRLSLHRN